MHIKSVDKKIQNPSSESCYQQRWRNKWTCVVPLVKKDVSVDTLSFTNNPQIKTNSLQNSTGDICFCIVIPVHGELRRLISGIEIVGGKRKWEPKKDTILTFYSIASMPCLALSPCLLTWTRTAMTHGGITTDHHLLHARMRRVFPSSFRGWEECFLLRLPQNPP